MERGRTGVTYGQAHYYPVCSNSATWVWLCGAVAPRTHQRCKAMLYTTPLPELRVTNYSQHHLAMCPALPWPPTTAVVSCPSPLSTGPIYAAPPSVPPQPAISVLPSSSTSTFATPTITQRGKNAIKIHNWMYVVKSEQKKWTTYRCSLYHKKCGSTCKVDAQMRVLSMPTEHNHEIPAQSQAGSSLTDLDAIPSVPSLEAAGPIPRPRPDPEPRPRLQVTRPASHAAPGVSTPIVKTTGALSGFLQLFKHYQSNRLRQSVCKACKELE